MRVALSATPPLLLDGLQRLLATAGVEVTIVLGETHEPFDVAITAAGRPAVAAPLVIELDDGPAGLGIGTISGAGGEPIVVLEGLPAIIDFITAWSRRDLRGVRRGQ
jgi:hypothetical protein